MSPTTRWCPTPEQLMILEEMYRGGIRTPNATQIQKITAHLSNYGRVEGKNVFYWFQNHKARDRQKLRRKLSKQFQLHHHHQLKQHHINHHLLHYLGSAQPPPPMATSSPISALQHLGLYNAATFLPPQIHGGLGGAGHVENTMSQIINSNNNINNMNSNNVCNKVFESSDIDDEEKKKMEIEMRKYKQNQADWKMMMMMEVPCCATTKPIKTLELFPLTATNLKE